VHQGDQFVEGGLIALSPCEEQSGDLMRVAGNAPNPTPFLAACQLSGPVSRLCRRGGRHDGQDNSRAGGDGGGLDSWCGGANRCRWRPRQLRQNRWRRACTPTSACEPSRPTTPPRPLNRTAPFMRMCCSCPKRWRPGRANWTLSLDELVFGTASRPLRRGTFSTIALPIMRGWRSPNVALLLGMVIAYEVGHLLLPASSHFAAGNICATWQRRIARLPTFTGDQGTTIRQLLAAGSGNQSQP
jgi:hypothetical protein